jgi:hypothetical protein
MTQSALPHQVMTREAFASRYELLQPLVMSEAKSYLARQRLTQRVVVAHFVDRGAAPNRLAVLSLLDRLEGPRIETVLNRVHIEDSTVIVTNFLYGFGTFRAWFESLLLAQSGASATPSTPAATPPTGSFTQVFRPPAPPSYSRSEGSPSASSFTQLFSPPRSAEIRPKADELPVTASSGPGDFTRVFKPSLNPSRPESTPRAEETLPLGSELPSTELPMPHKERAIKIRLIPPVSDPGVPRGASSPIVSTTPFSAPPGGATEALDARAVPPSAAPRASTPPDPIVIPQRPPITSIAAPPSPSFTVPEGPSEYTRIISGIARPAPFAPPSAESSPAQPQSVPPRASLLPIILVLLLALMAAVGLVVFLVARR